MKQKVLFFLTIVMLALAIVWFIKDANNHLECANIEEATTLANRGTVVTIQKHICRERFNF
jgi:hypothetical protein